MELVQVRLPKKLVKEVDKMTGKKGFATKSDFIRDAIRRSVSAYQLESLRGIMPSTGDSVQEIRDLRKKLSKEKLNLKEINQLAD